METKDFKYFLCCLEGYKVKFREFHWNAISLADHLLCDKVMDTIGEFQDSIGEEGFPIFEKFEMNEFVAIKIDDLSIIQALQSLKNLLIKNKNIAQDNIYLSGIVTMIDEFIHKTGQYIYLSNFQ